MPNQKKGTLVLEHERIAAIIERLAHQILENHSECKELILVGISGQGVAMRDRITNILTSISTQSIKTVELKVNKTSPLTDEVVTDLPLKDMKGKVVILIDDVLNSGKTLVYAMTHLLKADVKILRTVVLVDRIHRNYPIKADYVGLSLSTTIQERVEVEFGEEDYAYLV
jgi:pyrimidine operon attenuation protein/uracil phosphoribosyltransferase